MRTTKKVSDKLNSIIKVDSLKVEVISGENLIYNVKQLNEPIGKREVCSDKMKVGSLGMEKL